MIKWKGIEGLKFVVLDSKEKRWKNEEKKKR